MSQLRDALRRAGSCAAALALIGSTAVVLAPSVAADTGTRYVATDGDNNAAGGGPNDCTDPKHPCLTIQYAVTQADDGDTISIGAGTYSESVQVRESLTIVGAGTSGADDTIVSGPPDGSASSIFVDGIDTEAPIVVTVTNLDVSGNAGSDGIKVDSATLHLINSVASDNNDDGLDVLGASTATVDASTLSGNGSDGVTLNHAEGSESSPSVSVSDSVVSGNGDGGVIIEEGSALIEGTTLDKNVGAGVVADGGGTDATITTSTISGTVPFTGEEGNPFGGGVLVFPGATADISTSTIASNTGQGVYSDGGTVTITDSTITGTKSEPAEFMASGGVVYNSVVPEVRAAARVRAAVAEEGPGVTVVGTIIASQADGVPDCSGDITDGGYNLSSDAANSCGFSGADHDVITTNPKLGALQDNGGPTWTMKPAGGSPAIDAIPNKTSSCVDDFPTDQRGTARPIGPGCDIGAVETPAAVPPPPPTSTCPPLVIDTTALPDGTVGTPYSVQLKASGGCDSAYTWAVPSEAPEGGFPAAGTQTTAAAGEQSAAARPALDFTQPVFTPTVHSSPVAAPTSQAAGSESPAGNTAPPGLSLDANGVLSGTPTQAGTFTFTASVNDPVLATLVLHVAPAATGTSTATATTSAPSTSHGVGGVSTTAGAPVTATLSAGSGPLANTGATVGPQLRLALMLLIGGGALVLAGARRRKPRRH